jgi:hypothetical protein
VFESGIKFMVQKTFFLKKKSLFFLRLQFRNFLFPDIQIVSDGFCLIVQQIISFTSFLDLMDFLL